MQLTLRVKEYCEKGRRELRKGERKGERKGRQSVLMICY